MRRYRRSTIVWLVLGVVVGYAAGTYGGTFALAWLLGAVSEAQGWEVLVGAAGAFLTFGPLGAAVGALLALRPTLFPDDRRWLLAAAATAVAAAMVLWLAAGLLEAIAVFIWALTAALIVFLIGSARR